MMEKLQECTDFKGVKNAHFDAKSDLIYFMISPSIDSAIIDGLEIDLECKNLQVFEGEQCKFGVLVSDDPVMCAQLIPFFINKSLVQGKQFTKIVKIVEMQPTLPILKKSIKHLRPVTFKRRIRN